MSTETVLLEVTCGSSKCGLARDTWSELTEEGKYLLDPKDLRCPVCDSTLISEMKERESLT